MKLKNIISGIREGGIKYIIGYDGPNRKERRVEAAKARRARGGPKRSRPKNWDRDRHKCRKEQKRRRKQRWRR